MRGLTRALLALGAGCLMLAVLIGAIGLCLGGQFGSFQPTPDGLRYMPAGQDANDWVLTGGEERQEQTVPLPDGTFTGLELDGGLAEVTVRPGESWNLTTTHPELYEVSGEDGRLVIDSREPGISGHTVRNARLTLEVPAGLELETLELSIGLGSLNVRDLATGSLDVDAGMSGVTLTGITVRDDAELECGMGELTVENLTAKTVTGECGLGTMTLTDVTAVTDRRVSADVAVRPDFAVLADDDVPDVEISEATEVSTSFSQPATEVEIVRYAEDGTLEGVECSLEDGAAFFEIEPGWRYYVGAWFEGGDAGYLFDAKEYV